MGDRRYLLGILVYNGRSVVPRCLTSAARLVDDRVDVIVFDDASPSEGWSEEVAQMCAELGLGYYRTPRNLGIPRNMSLVMNSAVRLGYDVAGLVNSDVVLPSNLVSTCDAVLGAHDHVASITPWSNNVSAFSLPMERGEPGIADQAFVDHFARAQRLVWGSDAPEVPTGVGYCMLIPTAAIRHVGVMDPIFGRGYCEEVDWCQRARRAGLSNLLALGTYVFHEGSGTNREEGLLAHGANTVPEHEQILEMRYPEYPGLVASYLSTHPLAEPGDRAMREGLLHVARGGPYDLVVSASTRIRDTVRPAVLVTDTQQGHTRIAMHGLVADAPGLCGLPDRIEAEFDGLPTSVVLAEPGALATWYAAWAATTGIPVVDRSCYPNVC